MRDLKFRVWNATAKMVEPHMVYLDPRKRFDGDDLVSEEGWTVMQYTGLKDKNGKEIYEGDVIQVSRGARKTLSVIVWEQPVVRHDHEEPYEDLNGYVQFGCWRQKGVSSLAMYEGNFEVIGNIYENPDLLA